MAATERARARDPRDDAQRTRRIALLKICLRLLVSAALLAFLVTKIPAGSVEPKDTHAGTLFFFFAALALTFGGFVLSAWRWQRVLAVFDVEIGLRTLLSHYLAGQFVGNVLPSTIGGDVLRVSRSSKTAGGDVAFASVAIERLTGFVALPLLTLFGILVRPSLLELPHAWISIAIAGATVIALMVVLFVAGHPDLAGRFEKHQNWMRFVGAVHIGVDRLRREPRRAVSVLVAAVAYQASVVAAVWCAIHALGVSIPNGAVLAFIPAVAMAQVLPVSLGGLGIREGLLVLLLHPLGVPTGKAIGVGLLWYGMTLLVSLIGAPAFAVGHRHPADDDTSESHDSDAAEVHAPASSQ
ncbi:MAG TPA: lysylphosphatidylglycerol synthase transmembrane domain-containing protein [Acidimicrobiia bacterium]|nr:lysylphosphatidylglycerol synthase transmembrane domain-containing protein [Acidimicrobiia bacterium]